jgi:penicillin-binding protein 2
VLFTNLRAAARKITISDETIAALKRDLNGVVTAQNGTARRAFEGFCAADVPNSECAALRGGGWQDGNGRNRAGTEDGVTAVDTAWFVGGAPLSDPEFIVAVVIDQGGSGGQVAAPAARRILQFLMGEQPDPLRAGDDTER